MQVGKWNFTPLLFDYVLLMILHSVKVKGLLLFTCILMDTIAPDNELFSTKIVDIVVGI